MVFCWVGRLWIELRLQLMSDKVLDVARCLLTNHSCSSWSFWLAISCHWLCVSCRFEAAMRLLQEHFAATVAQCLCRCAREMPETFFEMVRLLVWNFVSKYALDVSQTQHDFLHFFGKCHDCHDVFPSCGSFSMNLAPL